MREQIVAEQTAQHEKELARLREEKKIAQDMIRFEFGLAALADSSKPDPMWVGVCVPARAGGSVVVDLVDAVGMTRMALYFSSMLAAELAKQEQDQKAIDALRQQMKTSEDTLAEEVSVRSPLAMRPVGSMRWGLNRSVQRCVTRHTTYPVP